MMSVGSLHFQLHLSALSDIVEGNEQHNGHEQPAYTTGILNRRIQWMYTMDMYTIDVQDGHT